MEVEKLEARERDEERELRNFIDDEKKPATETVERATPSQNEIVGRQSGTAEWKAARGEDGKATRGKDGQDA